MGTGFSSLFHNEGDVIVNISGNARESGTVKVTKSDLVQFVDTSFVFPKEKCVIDKEVKSADVKLSYSCVGGKCNFTEALDIINQSDELKGLGVKSLSSMIVNTIDQHPDVFPSQTAGGYIFQSTGRSFLYLENQTVGVKKRSPRYGFVDLTEVRKKLLFEAMRQKEHHDHDSWKDFALGAAAMGAVTSVTTIAILLKHTKP